MNNAVIITQAHTEGDGGDLRDMLRLTYQRHAAYARAHRFDFWSFTGDCHYTTRRGAWEKLFWVQYALSAGYPYVVWLDADAAIVNGQADLRSALPADKFIGCCFHDAPWFKPNDIPPHYNIGVMYWRNSEQTRAFLAEWLSKREGDIGRWMEQGIFNEMIQQPEWKDLFHPCEAKYNATVNVNMVDDPVVMGWHGVYPVIKRFTLMKAACKDDWMKFRV